MDTPRPQITADLPLRLRPRVPNYVVGLGASAGGLEALQQFFAAMPEDTGMAFVIIQHLSPHFKSMMDELLSRHTGMPITVVQSTLTMEADHVYLLPPGFDMVLEGQELSVRGKLARGQLQTPISDFFEALGQEVGDRSVAIVLSGTGSDGSTGVRTVWEHGGIVLAQSEQSAKFDSMPSHAISTGLAHAVSDASSLPAELLRLVQLREQPGQEQGGAETPLGDHTPYQLHHRILSQLDRVYDLNFAQYKAETIQRRIDRRVAISNSGSMEEYVRRLEKDRDELSALYNDLLIGVTRFFRDPDAFEVIRRQVVPELIEKQAQRDELRLWVAGCATGEEAYSLAILFLEAIEAKGETSKVRIFATDRHRESLRFAAEGLYSAEQIANIPNDLAQKYFTEEQDGRYRVIPGLRKCLVFSSHNILKDPPFTNIDFVSCRNLLIYFRPQAQRRVLGALYFSLRPKGYMFLGPSENYKDFEQEFRCVHSRWKVFEKITNYRIATNFSRPHLSLPASSGETSRNNHGEPWLNRAYNELLRRYVPTGALVTEQRQVLHLFGDAQNYLRPPEGRMSQDLVDMSKGNLKIALSSVIQRAIRSGEAIDLRSVEVVDTKEQQRLVDVRVEPVTDRVSKTVLYLVLLLNERSAESRFPDCTPAPAAVEGSHEGDHSREFDSSTEAGERIDLLEIELSHARQSLQSAVEELETSNEELQASNEELLASNEELQSTNEELHSVNEELYSINAEHEQKIEELHSVTGDLRNLMQSTDVGLIFTDEAHRIRLYTPKVTEILNLLPQDIGRELSHITSKIPNDSISAHVQEAATHNHPVDSRISLEDGRVFLRRIKPYLDLDQKRVGLILTFVEITHVHRAQTRQQEAELRVRLASQASGVGIWEWHRPSGVIHWDARMFELYDLAPSLDGTLTETSWKGSVNPQDWSVIEEALRTRNPQELQSFEMSIYRGASRQERTIRVDLTARPGPNNEYEWLIGTHFDITEEKQAKQLLEENEARYRTIIEHSPHGIATLDASGHIVQVNGEFARIFEGSTESFIGQPLAHFFEPPPPGEQEPQARADVLTEPIMGRRRSGAWVPLDVRQSRIKVRTQPLTVFFVQDLTEQQQSAKRRQLLAAIVENTDDAVISATLDGTVLSWNQGAERIYGFRAEEMLGQSLSRLVSADALTEHAGLLELAAQGQVVRNRQMKRLRSDDAEVDVAITLSPIFGDKGAIIGISSTERDISEQLRMELERRRIEAKMIESAKLESLGVLAGGIAHDFNNLLGGIMSSASAVEDLLTGKVQDDRLGRNLRIIREASSRAAELCHQLLAYSGRGRFVVERHDLSTLVEQTAQLIASSISKQIEVKFKLDAKLPAVSMDVTQVRQIVMNLVLNASEAIGDRAGKISISTGSRLVRPGEEPSCSFQTELEPGRYVTMQVTDSGCGIETEDIERIFDPFFTTKFAGRGLGLSAVLGIARGHRGGLWVQSAPGEGTTFTLFLRADEQSLGVPRVESSESDYRGGGEVLVVDDEPFLRESLSLLLESLGFSASCANDGVQALEMIDAQDSNFRLIILDLTMPRLNGAQTLRKIRESGNTTPVLLMSGYHKSEATASIDKDELSGFIPKPFDRQALVAALERCLPQTATQDATV